MENPTNHPIGWATAKRAAAHIGVSYRQIFKWAAAGRLQKVKVGGTTLFNVGAFESALSASSNRVISPAPPPNGVE